MTIRSDAVEGNENAFTLVDESEGEAFSILPFVRVFTRRTV